MRTKFRGCIGQRVPSGYQEAVKGLWAKEIPISIVSHLVDREDSTGKLQVLNYNKIIQ